MLWLRDKNSKLFNTGDTVLPVALAFEVTTLQRYKNSIRPIIIIIYITFRTIEKMTAREINNKITRKLYGLFISTINVTTLLCNRIELKRKSTTEI